MIQRLLAWLRPRIGNVFMNEVNFLAGMAHIGWAALILVVTALLSGTSLRWCYGVTAAMVLYAAIKEYVYDALFETPTQTFRDNTLDFVEYLGGLALGWAAILVHLRIG